MTARILVVDDIEANVRLLEARLTAEYYEVLTATDGPSCLALAASEKPDIILLDVMMPGMDGFQVCRRLKEDPVTRHIPVVLVTALDGRQDRIAGLEAGADEFLTKPIDDVMLFARVKSLARLKLVLDELRQREDSGRRLGIIFGAAARLAGAGGRVLIVDDNERQGQRLVNELSIEHRPVLETDPQKAHLTARGPVDLVIVNTGAKSFDGLRFAAQLRSAESGRQVPILALIDPDDREKAVKALELGVNDLLEKPIDPEELAARVRTQIRRKRYTELLRNNLDASLEAAVTDQLTGLHNRRYMTGQLAALVDRTVAGGEPVAVLMLDIDHFKKINDSFGHDVGDEVLREFAVRLASNVRAIDLPCRFGGEEFVVVMPGAPLDAAERVAERIRMHIGGAPMRVAGGKEVLTVTISIGVAAVASGKSDTPDGLLKRADQALYEAKTSGRNKVISRAA
ncbi:MAG: PleD family two-component system response regulator [Caulobacteraceae bacterium]